MEKKIINKKNDIHLMKAIVKSCKIKGTIVHKDEKEKNLRMIFKFWSYFCTCL